MTTYDEFFNFGMLLGMMNNPEQKKNAKPILTYEESINIFIETIFKEDKNHELVVKLLDVAASTTPSSVKTGKRDFPHRDEIQTYIDKERRDNPEYLEILIPRIKEELDKNTSDQHQNIIKKAIKENMIDKMPGDADPNDRLRLLSLYEKDEDLPRILAEIFIRVFKYGNKSEEPKERMIEKITKLPEKYKQEQKTDYKKSKDAEIELYNNVLAQIRSTMSPEELDDVTDQTNEELGYYDKSKDAEIEFYNNALAQIRSTMSPEELDDVTDQSNEELGYAGEIESPFVLKIVIDEFDGNVTDVANIDNEIEIRISRNQ